MRRATRPSLHSLIPNSSIIRMQQALGFAIYPLSLDTLLTSSYHPNPRPIVVL